MAATSSPVTLAASKRIQHRTPDIQGRGQIATSEASRSGRSPHQGRQLLLEAIVIDIAEVLEAYSANGGLTFNEALVQAEMAANQSESDAILIKVSLSSQDSANLSGSAIQQALEEQSFVLRAVGGKAKLSVSSRSDEVGGESIARPTFSSTEEHSQARGLTWD